MASFSLGNSFLRPQGRCTGVGRAARTAGRARRAAQGDGRKAAVDPARSSSSNQLGGAPVPSSNVWDYKPWWCKPYSILGTGLGVVWLADRVSGHAWWADVPVASVIALWWYLFLYLYPADFAASVEEYRREQALQGRQED